MGEIAYWDDQVRQEVDDFERLVSSLSGSTDTERGRILAQSDSKLARIQDLKKSLRLEMRLLKDKTAQRDYERKAADYDERLRKLQDELKWARTEGDRTGLMAGARAGAGGGTGTEGKDNDQLLNEASKLQDKTMDSLAHTRQLVEASKEVGQATVEELHRQRDQINDITEEVMQIEDNLARADRLLRTFGRRMATDRVIQCFALTNVAVLMVILIYIGVTGKSLGGSKGGSDPPDPDENRRLSHAHVHTHAHMHAHDYGRTDVQPSLRAHHHVLHPFDEEATLHKNPRSTTHPKHVHQTETREYVDTLEQPQTHGHGLHHEPHKTTFQRRHEHRPPLDLGKHQHENSPEQMERVAQQVRAERLWQASQKDSTKKHREPQELRGFARAPNYAPEGHA